MVDSKEDKRDWQVWDVKNGNMSKEVKVSKLIQEYTEVVRHNPADWIVSLLSKQLIRNIYKAIGYTHSEDEFDIPPAKIGMMETASRSNSH